MNSSINDSISSRKNRGGRRGFTLVELLVSISIASVLLIVNAVWIHQTLKYGKVQAMRKADHQSMTRLAWQFRDDVRESSSVNAINETKLQLSFGNDAKLIYTLKENFVLIERFAGEGNTVTRFESYRLPPNAIVKWDVSELPKWIALEVKRGGELLPTKRFGTENEIAVENASLETAMDLYVRVSPKRWQQIASQLDPPTSKLQRETAQSVKKPAATKELEASK